MGSSIANVQTCLGLWMLVFLGPLCLAHADIYAFQGRSRMLEGSSELKSCLNDFGAEILFPGSSKYETSRKDVWNKRTIYKPAAIVLATAVQHVQESVKCAIKTKYPIAPRSGGHSAEGYGTGGEDNYLVVDLGGFNNVSFDRKSMTATAGPGIRLGTLQLKLWNAGKVALPVGTCTSVGLGGHALGGGWGTLARKYGLAMDNILEVQMVTSTGEVVIASAFNNSDLFAAMKGTGKNNYGIVTRFKLQVHDMSANVTHFEYHFSKADQVKVLQVTQNMAWTAPPEITSYAFQFGNGTNLLIGDCLLAEAECRALLQDYIEGLEPGNGSRVATGPYIDSVLAVAGYNSTTDPAVLNEPNMPDEYVYCKGIYVNGTGLSYEETSEFVKVMQESPSTMVIVSISGNNSHTNKLPVKPGDGWIHRNELYSIEMFVDYSYDNKNSTFYREYADRWYAAVRPYATNMSFQSNMDKEQPLSAYYGENLMSLEVTKRKWDAGNVFRFNQSIPVYN